MKKQKISLILHRKIWNYTLLLSFLLVGISGLILAFAADYKILINGYRNLLWLHVETGILMGIISLAHTLWHWKYFFPAK